MRPNSDSSKGVGAVPTTDEARLELGVAIATALNCQGIPASFECDHESGEVIVDLPNGHSFVLRTRDFGVADPAEGDDW